jgi:hypothetical protein
MSCPASLNKKPLSLAGGFYDGIARPDFGSRTFGTYGAGHCFVGERRDVSLD